MVWPPPARLATPTANPTARARPAALAHGERGWEREAENETGNDLLGASSEQKREFKPHSGTGSAFTLVMHSSRSSALSASAPRHSTTLVGRFVLRKPARGESRRRRPNTPRGRSPARGAQLLLARDVAVRDAGVLAQHRHVRDHVDRRDVARNDAEPGAAVAPGQSEQACLAREGGRAAHPLCFFRMALTTSLTPRFTFFAFAAAQHARQAA